jgi:FAD/FMN-containing dehydrogenase
MLTLLGFSIGLFIYSFYCWLFPQDVFSTDLIDYQLEINKIKHEFNLLEKNKPICLNSKNHIGTLFRDRVRSSGLNFNNLRGIINFDPVNQTITVGGKTTFHDITTVTLPHNLAPMVVPEFRTITVGGAISGVGVESSSFKHGFPHENIVSFDILTSDGNIVTCTKNNEYSDLFYAIPNSYGTLGYITCVTMNLMKTKKYVNVTMKTYYDSVNMFDEMEKVALGEVISSNSVDFLESMIYEKDECVLISAKMSNQINFKTLCDLPENKYEELVRNKKQFSMTIYDYFWRWDTDMFWGTRMLPTLFHNPFIRKLLGRRFFNSKSILRLRSWISNKSDKSNKSNKSEQLFKEERIVQDIGIPIYRCAEFIEWLDTDIKIYPLWICPLIGKETEKTVLWKMKDNVLYCDIGVFGRTKLFPNDLARSHFNKEIETKMLEFGGKKCFYSDSFFSRETFEKEYSGAEYTNIKEKYDPDNRLLHVYDKCINKLL